MVCLDTFLRSLHIDGFYLDKSLKLSNFKILSDDEYFRLKHEIKHPLLVQIWDHQYINIRFSLNSQIFYESILMDKYEVAYFKEIENKIVTFLAANSSLLKLIQCSNGYIFP